MVAVPSADEDALAELEEDDRRKADAAEAIVGPALRADADSLDGFADGGCDERLLVGADAPPSAGPSEPDEADKGPTRCDGGGVAARGGKGCRAAKIEAAFGAASSGTSAAFDAAAGGHSRPAWSAAYCSASRSCLTRQNTKIRK